MEREEIIIIGLLLFLILSYYIGGGTATSNQGIILEKIAELKKEINKLTTEQDKAINFSPCYKFFKYESL